MLSYLQMKCLKPAKRLQRPKAESLEAGLGRASSPPAPLLTAGGGTGAQTGALRPRSGGASPQALARELACLGGGSGRQLSWLPSDAPGRQVLRVRE